MEKGQSHVKTTRGEVDNLEGIINSVEERARAKKTDIGVKLNESVWKAFRDMVYEKYGKFKDVLGYEVERALTAYLKSYRSKETRNPHPSTVKVYDKVKEYIKIKEKWDVVHEVPLRKLHEAIGKVRGRGNDACDKTKRKWIKRFKEEGLIKPVESPYVTSIWEMVR